MFARDVFAQMVGGASFLRSLGLGHRDVSMENFIINRQDDGRFVVKYIDFGGCLLLPRLPNNDICLIAPQGSFGKPIYIRLTDYDHLAF